MGIIIKQIPVNRNGVTPEPILELECKTITPISCGGWDNTYDKSLILRSSEVKALWRWWIRYLLSHYNIRDKKTVLEKILGSNNSVGNYKLIVVEPKIYDNEVFCQTIEKIENIGNPRTFSELINKNNHIWEINDNYLHHRIFLPNIREIRNNRKKVVDYIRNNYTMCEFKLKLYSFSNDQKYNDFAVISLITSLLLFGFGKNSRKGFGKCWIIIDKGKINLNNLDQINKVIDIYNEIKDLLDKINKNDNNEEFIINIKNKLNELIELNYECLNKILNSQPSYKFIIENVIFIKNINYHNYERILQLISIFNLKQTYKFITKEIRRVINSSKQYFRLWGHKYDTWIYGLPRRSHNLTLHIQNNILTLTETSKYKMPAKLFFVPFSNSKEKIKVILIIKIFDTIKSINRFTHCGGKCNISVSINYNNGDLVLHNTNGRINYNKITCKYCEGCNYCSNKKDPNIYQEIIENIRAFLQHFNVGDIL